ncbi:MAG: hypothetical protein KF805_07795 [Phycisphaeraceae bacterium]|nr:hypothetical protein [Phycisphaeraceae bacterium]
MQVNKKGTLEWYRFPYAPDPNGSFAYFTKTTSVPAECPGSDVGELVKHFTYDGVGRLIRVSSPIEAGEGYFFAGNSPMPITTFTRSERFYYDGTRRIQERELPWCAGNAITGSLRCRTRRARRG